MTEMNFSLWKSADEPIVIFYIPLIHLNPNWQDNGGIDKRLREASISARVVGVDQYAVAGCWVEIAIKTAEFLAICAGKHYFDKVLNDVDAVARRRLDALIAGIHKSLDQLVGDKHDVLCVYLRIRNRGRETTFNRRDSEEAHRAIRNAFFEILNKLERDSGEIYWLDRASYPVEGPIAIPVDKWLPNSQGGTLLSVQRESSEFAFWHWIFQVQRLRHPINEQDVADLRTTFGSGSTAT